jgi:glycosyltransferase involved in cell wall biosynthesis
VTVEILYCAWNRLALTEVSFDLLRRNTDWSLVDRLVIYDDGSEDGTFEYLDGEHSTAGPDYVELRRSRFRSPPTTMNDYLATTEADVFAKIDSDIAVPPGWLPAMLGVMERNPWLELLGMEAARTGPWVDGEIPPDAYRYEAATHIGGVGLMRPRAFHSRPPLMSRGRFGFTEWQHQHDPDRGWITPDLPVVQLDLIPEEPWVSLAEYYVAKGWARRWDPYDSLRPEWWRWLDDVAAQVAA